MKKILIIPVIIILLITFSSCYRSFVKQNSERNNHDIPKGDITYSSGHLFIYLPKEWEVSSKRINEASKRIFIEFLHRDEYGNPDGSLWVDTYVDYFNIKSSNVLSYKDIIDEYEEYFPTSEKISDFKIGEHEFTRFKESDANNGSFKQPITHVGLVGNDKYWISVFFDNLNRDKLVDDYYTKDFKEMLGSLVLRDVDWEDVKDIEQ